MSGGSNNDHSAGRPACNCLKNSDCILSFEVKAFAGEVDFYNADKQWESINLEKYDYKWTQNTPSKAIQLLADEKNGRNIEFLLTPKNCISESKDCPVAIVYEMEDSHLMMNPSFSSEYIAIQDGVLEKSVSKKFRFYTIDLEKYFKEKAEEVVGKGTAMVFGIRIDASVIKLAGQVDTLEAVETFLKKRLLFALFESLLTGQLNSFPHTSFEIDVLECNGIKGKSRKIPMRQGHAMKGASTLPEIGGSNPAGHKTLSEAPQMGQNSLTVKLDVYPVISFEFGVRGEMDIKNFIRASKGLPAELPPPNIDGSKSYGEGKDPEDKPIFYTIYNGKDNVVDKMDFDPLEIKEDLVKYIRKIVPFISAFDILDLMVTYVKNFTPNNPRPLYQIKALPPKLAATGHGSFRQNSEGQFYVHPQGEISGSPILGAELKIDMLKALVLMIPGGKLLAYFLEALESTQVAYQDGNSPFYLNAHADLFISPAINLTLGYSYNEQKKKMEISFLGNTEYEVLVKFAVKVGGAFTLCDIARFAFELSFEAEFKARLGLDKKENGDVDLVYFHDGIALRGDFAAKLWTTVWGFVPWKIEFADDVKYRGDILKREDSKYRINLITGKASSPFPAPSSWYPNSYQHYEPTPQQWRNVMNIQW